MPAELHFLCGGVFGFVLGYLCFLLVFMRWRRQR